MTTLLTYAQISSRIQIPIKTLYEYRKRGTGPHTIRIGRQLRVSEEDFAFWLTQMKAANPDVDR
jgi:hypothetical protein